MSIRKTGEKSLRKHEKNEISNAMSLRTDPEKIEKKTKKCVLLRYCLIAKPNNPKRTHFFMQLNEAISIILIENSCSNNLELPI
jgi:hypothetical protein